MSVKTTFYRYVNTHLGRGVRVSSGPRSQVYARAIGAFISVMRDIVAMKPERGQQAMQGYIIAPVNQLAGKWLPNAVPILGDRSPLKFLDLTVRITVGNRDLLVPMPCFYSVPRRELIVPTFGASGDPQSEAAVGYSLMRKFPTDPSVPRTVDRYAVWNVTGANDISVFEAATLGRESIPRLIDTAAEMLNVE